MRLYSGVVLFGRAGLLVVIVRQCLYCSVRMERVLVFELGEEKSLLVLRYSNKAVPHVHVHFLLI